MNSIPFPSYAGRIAGIAEALCRAVGNAIRPGFIQAVVAMLVYRRISRIRRLLLALEARLLAGRPATAPRISSRVDRAGQVAAASGSKLAHDNGQVSLPRRFSWLCDLVPGEAACLAGQLRVVLAEPGMAALLSQSGRAVRILSPLCWMLGIAPTEWLPRPDSAPVAVVLATPALSPAVEVELVVVADAAGWSPADVSGMGWLRFIPGS